MRLPRWILPALALLTLAACDTAGSGDAMQVKLDPVSFSDVPNWTEDEHAEPFRMFAQTCAVNARRGNDFVTRTGVKHADASAWRSVCAAASALPNPTDEEARDYFESHFTPYRATSGTSNKGLTTGYYEPMLHGSYQPSARFHVPVYGVPHDFRKPYLSRAEIESRGLKGKAPILLYVDDKAMLFFLHIQGSGKVRMTDGSLVTLQYAQQNGHPYVPIGRVMRERGYLSVLSLQTIRQWLNSHPQQADEVMNINPSYIFFALNRGAEAAKGAIGIPVTAERTIAVDDERVPYGTPIFLSTTTSTPKTGRPRPFDRLMIAQDTGGAIIGPIRYDMFFGRGARAEWKAGHQNTPANVYWLLPNSGGLTQTLDPTRWF